MGQTEKDPDTVSRSSFNPIGIFLLVSTKGGAV